MLSTIQFGGIPLYSFNNGMTVYQLETKDIPALKKIKRDFKEDTFKKTNLPKTNPITHRQHSIMAVEDIIKTLQLTQNHQFKTNAILLMAVHNKRPVGILGGNFLKLVNTTEKTTYSTYDLSGKMKDAELDWLMAFPYSKKVEKVGSILLTSFIKELNKLNQFKTIHLRASTPEKSYAVKFYQRFGFKKMGKPQKWIDTSKPRDLIFFLQKKFQENDDLIQPMKQTMEKALKQSQEFQKKFIEKEWQDKRSLAPEQYLSNDYS